MNRIGFWFLLLLGWMMLMLPSSCRRCTDPSNPDCKNFDPCYGKSGSNNSIIPSSSYLKSGDWIAWPGFTMDSVVPPHGIPLKFSSEKTAEEYIWYVGQDTISGKSFVNTSFGSVPIGGPYPITLIIHKEVDIHCFPNDNAWDTTSIYIYKRGLCDLKISGRFRMKPDAGGDSIEITNAWMYPPGVMSRDSCIALCLQLTGAPWKPETHYYPSYSFSVSDHTIFFIDPSSELLSYRFNFIPSDGSFELFYSNDNHPNEIRYHGRKLE